MQFYHVTDNSFFSKNWAWAWSIKPWEHEISTLCDICGKGRLYPGRYPDRPLFAEVEGGKDYPDVLGCAAPYLIVSETVIGDWEANHVTGYEKFPLIIRRGV